MRFCSNLALAALLAFAPHGRAAETKPAFHASLSAALQAAAAEKVPVLVIISAAGTHSAREVDQALTGEALNKLGALKIATLNTDLNPGVAQKFSVSVLPAFILLGPDGKLVSRHEGFGGIEELLDWLKEARSRISRGEWEGSSTAKPIDLLAAKAAKGDLTDADLAKMAADLANPDPAERAQIAGLLIEQRERAVAPLLERLSDPYLGARVAANDILRQLLPGAPDVDPWIAPKDAAPKIAELQKWWTAAGKIPDKPVQAARDPATLNSIRAAIDKIKGDDPVVRTEAMSALVRFGDDALQMIRDAIKRAEKNSDQRSAGFLEEVRWSILVPASAERIAGGVRQPLARGSSPERQSAAARLGRAGASGIPALAELVNDADPLIVETAVRSLSSIGGAQTIPAMAALLKAGNSNLRMTAAQAMGKTKRKEAVPHLLAVVDDPNEVVACAAISAIEEIFSKGDAYSNKSIEIPPEVLTALKTAMTDPRWRVRATAVEIAGKLNATDLSGDARKLIRDSDPFVVKTALHALQPLGAAPEASELGEIMTRIPSLRAEIIALMIGRATPDVIKTVHDLYLASKPDEQVSILNALTGADRHGPAEIAIGWKPTLAHAISSPNAQLRSTAANLLVHTPPEVAAGLVSPLLTDADAAVRRNAALVVLNILGAANGSRTQSGYGVPNNGQITFKLAADKKEAWSTALAKSTDTNLYTAIALYLATDGTNGLERIGASLDRVDNAAALQLNQSGAFAALLPKLSWPAAKSIFEKIRAHPLLLASAAGSAFAMKPEAADFLLEPAAVRATLEKVPDDQAINAVNLLSNSGRWSIYGTDPRAKALIPVFLDSKNPKWRLIALSALANSNSETNLGLFTAALRDPYDLIRVVAIQGIDGAVRDRAEREKLLGPLLADEKQNIRHMAALALIDSDIRDAAQIGYLLKVSPLGGMHTSYNFPNGDDDRPLPAPFPKPSFVQSIVEQIPNTNAADLPVFALLLGQYGIFDALDRIIAAYGAPTPAKFEDNNEILVAIGLSKDAKYIPFLRTLAVGMKDEYNLRRILRAVKGMTGREAREFRVELNKLMRKTT